MILIYSNSFDKSTNDVMDWLTEPFHRLHEDDFLVEIDFSLDSLNYSLEFKNGIKINKISSFWYRRGGLSLKVAFSAKSEYTPIIKFNCDNEWEKLKRFLVLFFEINRSLGSFQKESDHNKLWSLYQAQKMGLKIPNTLLTNNKSSCINFKQSNTTIITKAINNMFMSKIDAFNQWIGVHKVGLDNLDLLKERFFPTLFQNEIEKAFELRIVYIKNHFFAMAIFSQNDEMTKVDYRNYNRQKPNRNIPYILSQELNKKLQKLMNHLELDSGSIDMIVTPTGEYVFLEVNPTGQFGWVSENCNYYLEQKIAHYLQHGEIIHE